MKALLTIAAAIATLCLSPGARSWLGELLFLVGLDLMDSGPGIPGMTEEQLARGRERIMDEIKREQSRAARNGGRP